MTKIPIFVLLWRLYEPVGLIRPRFSCWGISVLQLLRNIPDFRAALQNFTSNDKNSVCLAIKNLYDEMLEEKIVDPTPFFTLFKSKHPVYDISKYNNAALFMRNVLSACILENSAFSTIFTLTMVGYHKCTELDCIDEDENEARVYSEYIIITPSNENSVNNVFKQIQYQLEELKTANNQGVHGSITVRKIVSLPSVLLIYYEVDRDDAETNNRISVESDTIDMAEFMDTPTERTRYKLHGMVRRLNSNHFVTDILYKGEWFTLNDTKKTKLESPFSTKNASILMYILI